MLPIKASFSEGSSDKLYDQISDALGRVSGIRDENTFSDSGDRKFLIAAPQARQLAWARVHVIDELKLEAKAARR